MRLIYHDETKPLTYEQVYEACQRGYGVKRPDRISGFMGFFLRLPDIYAYGRLEMWLEHDPSVEDELLGFIRRYVAKDYGFVTRSEHDNNIENNCLCGTSYDTIARYSFSEERNHYGGVILEFFEDFGLFYSIEEDMSNVYKEQFDDPEFENEIQYVDYREIQRRSNERSSKQ